MEFHLVEDVDEVVRLTLEGAPTPMAPKGLAPEAGTTPPTAH
jgi:hypothetical protein